MYDATPFQVVAHGFVPLVTVNGPIAAFAEGVSLIQRTGVGITEIFLDTGLPGGGAVANPDDVRIFITPSPNPGIFPVAFDAAATLLPSPPVSTGGLKITVEMWNTLTSDLVDNGYWFMVGRPGESGSK
jgi:hypothetical protein